ncbi:plasmid mobilization protein [Streptomyces sp. NPDC017941]|uniref:plasmid mobilization protein n=1 Tax=Streptomyces sp. NPDC017941 TaxID=3365018 RepID=UPI0037B8472A
MDGAKPVQVLFSPDEYAAVARQADRLGMTPAEFIRRAAAAHAGLEAVHAGGEPDTCDSDSTRRGAAVPPVRRGPGTRSTPALQRFLDTLATAEPARVTPQQSTVRTRTGP